MSLWKTGRRHDNFRNQKPYLAQLLHYCIIAYVITRQGPSPPCTFPHIHLHRTPNCTVSFCVTLLVAHRQSHGKAAGTMHGYTYSRHLAKPHVYVHAHAPTNHCPYRLVRQLMMIVRVYCASHIDCTSPRIPRQLGSAAKIVGSWQPSGSLYSYVRQTRAAQDRRATEFDNDCHRLARQFMVSQACLSHRSGEDLPSLNPPPTTSEKQM